MTSTYGTALITGASSGIGAAFAQALAAQGSELLLVARSGDKLEALAAQLRAQHGRRVDVVVADLGLPGAAAALAATAAQRGLSIDLLVNNAGFGSAAAFVDEDPAHAQRMIALNCAALVDLAHAFVPAMLARGHGGLINVASMAAFQPAPYMSLYGATKAFVLSYSEGLWAECRARNVHVLALCPGPVDTGFFAAAGDAALRDAIPSTMMMQADAVVAAALRALSRGDSVVVPGALNKLAAQFPRLLPRSWVARMAARVMLEPQRRRK
ncbi:SDR family NAD(P)-dependent oxidoreductase [Solimonas terrae]|uniref:SDR family oxidoreductase n=1 Tax=Solimonas terrae TaxID=1396819 RepID=A0A6M2BTU5_9GAMM|nr:SDR family oxidoreductase [Solimonas terrae]NGY05641.1 SDR family oxidoreductase [Solimonas terrae]